MDSIEKLDDLFQRAARTERTLPLVVRKRVRAAWPLVAPDPMLAYGYNETVVHIQRATASEISEYEKALELTLMMEDERDRKIVWAVAHSGAWRERGPAWTAVGRMVGLHARTVKRRYFQALGVLYYRLLLRVDEGSERR